MQEVCGSWPHFLNTCGLITVC